MTAGNIYDLTLHPQHVVQRAFNNCLRKEKREGESNVQTMPNYYDNDFFSLEIKNYNESYKQKINTLVFPTIGKNLAKNKNNS